MKLKASLNFNRKFITAFAIVIIGVGGFVSYMTLAHKNPLPATIKNQISFKVVYPSHSPAKIDTSSYNYQSGQNALTFNTTFANTKVVFTEQPAPSTLGSGSDVYYQAIGLHPYAQFKTSLGTVALAKFWESETLKPQGQSAILATKGTLVIAHSDQDLTNQQWKSLFDSLTSTR